MGMFVTKSISSVTSSLPYLPALNNARSLHDQAMDQANRTRDLGAEVKDIADKLRDLNNNSRHALDNAQAANDLNNRNKQMKDRLLAMIGELSHPLKTRI